jgi:propanol-preferring alcohol dehydrogenase
MVSPLGRVLQNLPLELAAPIACSGLTVWKAIKQSNTKPGDYLLVSGAGGGLGSLCVQYARAVGLRVVAVDTGDAKRKLCKELGASEFIDFRQTDDMIQTVRRICDGGPHVSGLREPLGRFCSL